MAARSEATKAIGRAARDGLRPLGLLQVGRSRTWLDDRGWWVIVVEFQPSGFSSGSYLNVGLCWLWWPSFKSYVSFDVGYRVEGHQPFRTVDQFEIVAAELAARAVSEVRALRERFSTLDDALLHLRGELRTNRPSLWDHWNSAMGYALAGLTAEAARAATDPPPSTWGGATVGSTSMPVWELDLRQELARFAAMDGDAMLVELMTNIARARAALGLPDIQEGL